jgi:hypothetical protein
MLYNSVTWYAYLSLSEDFILMLKVVIQFGIYILFQYYSLSS